MLKIHEVVDREGKALRSPDFFHPGYILKEEIEAREITKKDFAQLLNILPTHLSEIFAGKRSISAKMALRLETALEISAAFWLRMQLDFDLKLARVEMDPVVSKIADIVQIQLQTNAPLSEAINTYDISQKQEFGRKAGKRTLHSDPKVKR